MIRMFARRTGNTLLITNTDVVAFGLSLPSDSVIHDIRAKISLVSGTHLLHSQATMYACEAWIIPVVDLDAGAAFETLWDIFVPKDTDVQTMDLDKASADTAPFFEPGESDWSSLMDVGLRPERLYHRKRLLNLPNGGSVHTFQDNQSPFAVTYLAGDSFQLHIRKRLAVRQPAVLLVALASPSLGDTTAVGEAALLEAEWGQIKYVGHVLERALLDLFGVTETGAETPWEEATDLLQAHLDPDVREMTANRFQTLSFDVYHEAIIDHSVVGRLGSTAVTTGR